MESKIFSHFNLTMKIKNLETCEDGIHNKFSETKDLKLLEGENFVGSDICKCNIYLPFDDVPGIVGKIIVRKQNNSWKLFLQSLANDSKYFISKFRGKKMIEEKEHFIKPNQKIFIEDLIVLSVQKVFYSNDSSVCFEEENLNIVEELGSPERVCLSVSVESGKVEKKPIFEEVSLNKRNEEHLTDKEDKKDEDWVMETPKKLKKVKKSKENSEVKTSIKILNFFKKIEKIKKTEKKAELTEKPIKKDKPQKEQTSTTKKKEKKQKKNKKINKNNSKNTDEQKVTLWICFSNVTLSIRHQKMLAKLTEELQVTVFENFEDFVNTEADSESVQKVLIMSEYKRTYKLIVAHNLNIPILKYEWILSVADQSKVIHEIENFLVKSPVKMKNVRKSGIKKETKAYDPVLVRKPPKSGFLKGYNVIIYDKCFNSIKVENLNISKTVPEESKHTRRGIRSGKSEKDHQYIMRRIVETAHGDVQFISDLSRIKKFMKKSKKTLLVVDKLRYSFLNEMILKHHLIIFSKESFLNSFLRQSVSLLKAKNI